MGAIADVTRPLWVSGLNEINGRPSKRVSGWVCDENYSLPRQIVAGSIELQPFLPPALLEAIAFDCGRFCGAAAESLTSAWGHPAFRKSYAWLLIKDYYAAFYAAHGIMRYFGQGVIHLQAEQIQSIARIHNLFYSVNCELTGGQYAMAVVPSPVRIRFDILASGGGIHEQFWAAFGVFVRWLSSQILTTSGVSVVQQAVTGKWDELYTILHQEGCNRGNWLSKIRNDINYRHGWSVWHPYDGQPKSLAALKKSAENWKIDPMGIDLAIAGRAKILVFHAGCRFLIAACCDIAREMAGRCPVGQSFLRRSILDVTDRASMSAKD